MLVNLARFSLVTAAIVVITSFSVDATDTLRGSETALSIFSRYATEAMCPDGMIKVADSDHSFCIDMYEAGVDPVCPFPEPFSVADTASNAMALGCTVISKPQVRPWRFVNRVQAEQLCARVGKRLPTDREWYQAALGTIDSAAACNTASGEVNVTAANPLCHSGVGAFDMVGNVWEFTVGGVVDGNTEFAHVPESGYVAGLGTEGFATLTTTTPQEIFNNDFFWSNATGTFSVMRGGFYGSRTDGGLYATHAAIQNTFSSAAIGFRCVKSL